MTNALMTQPETSFLPSRSQTQDIWKLAETLCGTDFVPKAIRNNAPAVMAAILTGREMGIGPLRALRQIPIVDGKPAPSPELMMARVLNAGHHIRVVKSTRTECVVECLRSDWPAGSSPSLVTWDLEDALDAGLIQSISPAGKAVALSRNGNPLPWQAYTRAMLRSRAVGEACRMHFPDVVEGTAYAPEELGADVVNEMGQTAHTAGIDPLEGESEETRAAVADAIEPGGDVIDAEFEVIEDEPQDIAVDTSQPIPRGSRAGQPWSDQTRDWLQQVIESDKSNAHEKAHAAAQLAHIDANQPSKVEPLDFATKIGSAFGTMTYAEAMANKAHNKVLEQVSTSGRYTPTKRATASAAISAVWGGDIDLDRAIPRGALAGIPWAKVDNPEALRRISDGGSAFERMHAAERLEQLDAANAAAVEAAEDALNHDGTDMRTQVLTSVKIIVCGEEAAMNGLRGLSGAEAAECASWITENLGHTRSLELAGVEWVDLVPELTDDDIAELTDVIETHQAEAE